MEELKRNGASNASADDPQGGRVSRRIEQSPAPGSDASSASSASRISKQGAAARADASNALSAARHTDDPTAAQGDASNASSAAQQTEQPTAARTDASNASSASQQTELPTAARSRASNASSAAERASDVAAPRSFSSLRGSAYAKAVRAGVTSQPIASEGSADIGVDLAEAAAAIETFLRALGHPPESDPELAQTGQLVAAAFHRELLSGYRRNPAEILAQSMPTQSSALVVLRGIDVVCICPHHLLPSTGVLHIGYLPNERIVGFGALAQLAHCYSRRLILQETLCEQVANALVAHLGALGAGCIADLAPACLTCRGERPAHARVVSFAAAGRMRDDAALRAEFMSLAQARSDLHGGNMEPSR